MRTPIAELRFYGDKIGRRGMSDLAKEFVDKCDGSPKGYMELCGKLSVIAKMATCDDYWDEQVNRGVYRAEIVIDRDK